MKITNIFDKTGSLGALTAAMSCTACFPALGSLGAALGLGFLSQFEGMFLITFLPFFAVIALGANIYGYKNHQILHRTIAGIIGPILVLIALYPLAVYGWREYVLYTGILAMLAVSIWDISSPTHKVCRIETSKANA